MKPLRLALALVLLNGTALSAQAAESVRLKRIEPRLGGFYRPGRWMAVQVTVENTGEERPVWVQLVDQTGEKALRYQPPEHAEGKPVVLAGVRWFEIYAALAADSTLRLQVLDDARPDAEPLLNEILDRKRNKKLDAKSMPVDLAFLGDDERLVAVVQDLGRLDRRPFHDPDAPGDLTPRFVDLDSGSLPIRPEGYESLDVLLAGDLRPRALSPRQQDALRRWILGGGRVLVANPRAFRALERVLFGSKPTGQILPRTWENLRQRHAFLTRDDVRAWGEPLPNGVEVAAILDFRAGFGRVIMPGPPFNRERAGIWSERGRALFAELLADRQPAQGDPRIDRSAYMVHEAEGAEDPFGGVLVSARTWSIFFVLLMAAVLAAAYRRALRPATALAVLAAPALGCAFAALRAFPRPGAGMRVFEIEQFSGDGRARRVESLLWVSTFRDGTVASVRCVGGAARVLAFSGSELAAIDCRMVAPDLDTDAAVRELWIERDKPLILATTSTEPVNPESRPGRDGGGERTLSLPFKNGSRMARVTWRLPPAFDPDAPFGTHVLAYGFAYPVDLESGLVGEPVRLKAFVEGAFPRTDRDTAPDPARVRRTESLRAAVQSRPKLMAMPWVLVVWDRPRIRAWRLDGHNGAVEFTGALRVIHPASVEVEKAP